jgi:predicted PurR-regulated permease PerM
MSESRNWFILALIVGAGWLIYLLAPVNRTLAVVLVFLMISAAIFQVLLILLPMLRDQIERLVEKAPAMLEWVVGTALPWVQVKLGLSAFEVDAQSLTEALKSYWKEVSTALVGVLGSVSRGGQAMLNWLVNLLLVPVVTFYLLRDWDRLVEGIRTLIPRKAEPVVSQLFREIESVLGAFIRGQLMVMFALGLIYSIGLWLVGLDLALIIGMGAGLLSIVPYLGTFVGVVAAVIAVVFQFQDWLHTVLVLAVFGVGQSMEGMVLTPKLVGDRVGLHPVVVIFAVLAGGQLFGFLGILLALPVASALNVLVNYMHQRYRESSLYLTEAGKAEDD